MTRKDVVLFGLVAASVVQTCYIFQLSRRHNRFATKILTWMEEDYQDLIDEQFDQIVLEIDGEY